MTWASILSLLKSLVTPIWSFLLYYAGRRSAITESELDSAKKDAELNSGYAEILADRPEPGESTRGMREGEWPTK